MAAPNDALYVLLQLNEELENARTLAPGVGMTLNDGGPEGEATLGATGTLANVAQNTTPGLLKYFSAPTGVGVVNLANSDTIHFAGGSGPGGSVTGTVQDGTSIQNVTVQINGSSSWTGSTINLKTGPNMGISAATGVDGRRDITFSSGSGGGGAPSTATFVTVDDETGTLPNSATFSTLFDAAIDDATPWTPGQGGTGIPSYALGDLLYASNSTTLSRLAVPALPGKYNLTWDHLVQQLIWETQPDVPADLTDIDFVTLTDQTATLPNSVDFVTLMDEYLAAATPWLDSQGGTGVESFDGPYRLLYSSATGNTVANLAQPTNSGVLVQVPGSAPSFVQITPDTPGYLHVNSSGVFTWDDLILPTGTVTSVQITSTGGNAILSGTNPITTNGTINIDVHTPIKGNSSSVFFTYVGTPSNFGQNNFVYNPNNLINTTALFQNNIVMGNTACGQATNASNIIALGDGSLASCTDITNVISVGVGTLGAISSNSDITKGCVVGHNSFAALTSSAEGLTSFGHGILPYQTNFCFHTTAVGGEIGASMSLSTATMQYCTYLGNEVLTGGNSAGYDRVTLLGYKTDIRSGVASISYATAVGAEAVVYDDYLVQLGYRSGLGIDAHFGSPATVSEERIVMWLDGTGTANNLVRILGNTPYRTGAPILLNNGFTCGTATLVAGVNPSVSVSTSAGTLTSYAKVSLTLRPTPGVSFGAVGAGPLSGSGFTIYMSGTLSSDIAVDWEIHNFG